MTSDTKIIGGIIVLTILLIAGFGFTGKKSTDPIVATRTGQVMRDDAFFEGPADAPITLVEFGDFQCPACKQMFPAVNNLLTTFPNQVKVVFREYPLRQHANARAAAAAAEAAGAQGKFWEMHTFLYERQTEWDTAANPLDDFTEYANLLGLDMAQWRTDMESDLIQRRISQDVADGDALGVPGTPTFYVNGTQIEALNQASLEEAIRVALATTVPAMEPTPVTTSTDQ